MRREFIEEEAKKLEGFLKFIDAKEVSPDTGVTDRATYVDAVLVSGDVGAYLLRTDSLVPGGRDGPNVSSTLRVGIYGQGRSRESRDMEAKYINIRSIEEVGPRRYAITIIARGNGFNKVELNL